MDERVFGAAGSAPSTCRRRRLRAMIRGYPMSPCRGLALAALFWAISWSPALAQDAALSGSRYSAPLWAWIAAIVVAAGLGVIGLGVGVWFRRKRSRLDSSD